MVLEIVLTVTVLEPDVFMVASLWHCVCGLGGDFAFLAGVRLLELSTAEVAENGR
jgi:hypothetical protein